MCSKISLVFLILPLILSCSIKENRTDCPCHLYFDLSSVSREHFSSVSFSLSESGQATRHYSLDLSEISVSEPFCLDVPKSIFQLQFSAVENGATWLSPGNEHIMTIPVGEQCPPLFTHFSQLDARGEEYVEKVDLHKNFCTLHITMVGNDPSKDYPFSLRVQGEVNGYDEVGRPQAGKFGVYAYPTREGKCSVRVPRQRDDSLELLLCEGDGVLADFAIGNFIQSRGYDWSARDLEDISLRIDCARLAIEVECLHWTDTYYFNIEI